MTIRKVEVAAAFRRSMKYRAVGYFGLSAGAIASTFLEPPVAMARVLPTAYLVGWGIVYMIGSIACLWGAIKGEFGGEQIGCVPVGCSLVAFGIAVMSTAHNQGAGVVVSACSMIGLGFLFFARWRDVNWMYHLALGEVDE